MLKNKRCTYSRNFVHQKVLHNRKIDKNLKPVYCLHGEMYSIWCIHRVQCKAKNSVSNTGRYVSSYWTFCKVMYDSKWKKENLYNHPENLQLSYQIHSIKLFQKNVGRYLDAYRWNKNPIVKCMQSERW